MAIEFTKKDLENYAKKKGVYSTLSKPIVTKKEVNDLRWHVFALVELAFMQYAKAHGCKNGMLKTEWNRFKVFLEKEL